MGEGPDVVTLIRNLHRIGRYSFEQVMATLQLKRSQISVLKMVHEAKLKGVLMNFKMIAQELGVKTATISPIVCELVEMGYLTERVDEHDRRIKYCEITDLAMALMEEAQVKVVSSLNEVLGGLNPNELQEFIRLTNKIAGSINKEDKHD